MSFSVEIQILVILAFVSLGRPYQILVMSHSGGSMSHLLRDVTLGDLLGEAGHQVTYLLHDKHSGRGYLDSRDVILYQLPDRVIGMHDFDWAAHSSILHTIFIDTLVWRDMLIGICSVLIENKTLLQKLKDTKYDLIIVDSSDECGKIVVDFLSVPIIVHKHEGVFLPIDEIYYPSVSSFTCLANGMACKTDSMFLRDTVWNFIIHTLYYYLHNITVFRALERLKEKHNMSATDVRTIYVRSVMVADLDFTLEYPRSLTPNIIPISGISSFRAALPLDKELVQFIESSSPYGIIIFSLGTFVNHIPPRKADMIARIFGRLKEKVIWRYPGSPPDSLANNTLIRSWFPQNEVLAHRLTKLSITHCGRSSVYETIYNAVPVVALPIFADQFHNANLLVRRLKMGVQLDFNTMNEDQLEAAVVEVIGNVVYTRNAKKFSNILLDKVVLYKHNFPHAVDYVIQHKGAKHLIPDVSFELSIV